jgi:hypothetical protein
MTIKIPVEADLGNIDQAVNKAQAAGEKATQGLIDQQRKFREEVERTKRTVEELQRLLGRTVTEDQARALNARMGRYARSGGFGSEFLGDVDGFPGLMSRDFEKKFSHAEEARRVREETLRRMLPAIGIEPQKPSPSSRWTRMAGAATGAVTGAILGGGDGGFGGMLGGAAGGFAGTALALGNPIGGIIGSTLGAGLGSAIDRHLDRALTEALETSNLRKNLGGLSAEFDALREVSRSASSGLGMASTEFLQAERAFARTAATLPGEVQGLVSETRGAAQFARSLGLSPEAGITFFAQERQFRGTNDEAGARRLGFSIAEAMNRGGLFSKADEVLQAVAGFTATAARSGLTTPNVGGYTDILAALAGQGGPYARDVQGAAGLLGRLDASFRGAAQGGSEGWRNFLLGGYQRAFGAEVNGLDLSNIQEGGLFGTLEGAIGEGSVAWKAADPDTQRHYAAMLAQAKARGAANIPFIDIQMAQLKQETGGNVQWMAAAAQRNMGIGSREFYALWEAYNKPGGITGLYNKLKGYQVDPDTLPMGNIIALSQLATGGRDDLMKQANRLLSGDGYANKLTGEEADRLQKAMGSGNVEELRQAVVQLTANQEMKDLGEKSLDALKKIENEITSLSAGLLPVMTNMRDAILAKFFGTPGGFEAAMKKWSLSGEESAITGAKSSLEGRQHDISRIQRILELGKTGFLPSTRLTPEQRARYEGQLRDLEALQDQDTLRLRDAQIAYSRGSRSISERAKLAAPSQYDDLFKEAADQYGLDWMDLKALAVHESGLNPNAEGHNSNGTVDQGIMQLNNRYHAARGVRNPFDVRQNIFGGARAYAEALKAAGGNRREAFRRYNGSGAAAENYADEMMTLRRSAIGTPLPAGHHAEGGRFGMDDVNINVHHHHVDSNGVPVAPPVVETHVGRPRLLNAVSGRPALSEMF